MMDLLSRFIAAITELHPMHSMVVHFPIALTGVALFFLVLALWRRNEGLERAAFYNITLSAVATVVAGVTGYRDSIVRFEGDAPLVGVKIFLAITLLILTVAIAISRWRSSEIAWKPSTMVIYLASFAASFALALTLGFLGGVILYGF